MFPGYLLRNFLFAFVLVRFVVCTQLARVSGAPLIPLAAAAAAVAVAVVAAAAAAVSVAVVLVALLARVSATPARLCSSDRPALRSRRLPAPTRERHVCSVLLSILLVRSKNYTFKTHVHILTINRNSYD